MMPTATSNFKKCIEDYLGELLDGYTPLKIRCDKIIRDAILGHHIFFRHEINLIDSPLLQRLRRIHQTSLAYLTYPAATHTRFEHSLGVVVFTQRMINAINTSSRGQYITDTQSIELRLAALLHDCGHCVFSHASEIVYDDWDIKGEIKALRKENPELLGEAAGHEIFSYFIVKSERFKELWENIISHYELEQEKLARNLKRVKPERVANMIVGVKAAPHYPTWISKIINGPFDADKLDYMGRDGYFSGLLTPIDTDRLFVSLSIFNPTRGEPYISVDIGGATVLEQVLFNKMLLFSSVYNHHKVRSAFLMIASLIHDIRKRNWMVSNVRLESSVDFLRLDEYGVLNARQANRTLVARVKKLRERILLKRALVIAPQALRGYKSQQSFFELGRQKSKRDNIELELARKTGCDTAFVDFPPIPRVDKMGEQSMVKLSENTAIPLSKLYPAAGWIRGYSQYRRRDYVLASPGYEQEVAVHAFRLFEENGIKLKKQLCLELSKRPGVITQ
jgi:HD superfamily phosphohydrolase